MFGLAQEDSDRVHWAWEGRFQSIARHWFAWTRSFGMRVRRPSGSPFIGVCAGASNPNIHFFFRGRDSPSGTQGPDPRVEAQARKTHELVVDQARDLLAPSVRIAAGPSRWIPFPGSCLPSRVRA